MCQIGGVTLQEVAEFSQPTKKHITHALVYQKKKHMEKKIPKFGDKCFL